MACDMACDLWGFPKIRGTILGVPIIRTIVFWGLYWGPPILENYHISRFHISEIKDDTPNGTTDPSILHSEFHNCGGLLQFGNRRAALKRSDSE